MGLVGESELFIMADIIDVGRIVFLDGVLASVFTVFFAICSFLNRLNLLDEMFMLVEELVCIDSSDYVYRDVWGLMLEATMHIDIGIDGPASMAEALQRVEFVPFG